MNRIKNAIRKITRSRARKVELDIICGCGNRFIPVTLTVRAPGQHGGRMGCDHCGMKIKAHWLNEGRA